MTALLASLALATVPLGHAHNDYEHPRPLFDAYENGFRSIEADVFPVDGALWVAHDKKGLDPKRTLRSLYLEPMARQFAKGRWHEPIDLLVDIKEGGAMAYAMLQREVAEYPVLRRKVRFVISGDRPVAAYRGEPGFALDGRWADRRSGFSPGQMPIISEFWYSRFRWMGGGAMPAAEMDRLKALVSEARKEGRTLRFWGAPDTPALWQALRDAGVGYANTDRLAEFRAWATAAAARG